MQTVNHYVIIPYRKGQFRGTRDFFVRFARSLQSLRYRLRTLKFQRLHVYYCSLLFPIAPIYFVFDSPRQYH